MLLGLLSKKRGGTAAQFNSRIAGRFSFYARLQKKDHTGLASTG